MKNLESNQNVYDTTIKLFILWLIIGWCLLLMYPFISVIMWSLIFAIALHPLHTSVARKIGNRPKLASFLIISVILLIVILPSFFLVGSLVKEVKELKLHYDSGTLIIPPPTATVKSWPLIGTKVYDIWHAASSDLSELIATHKEQLVGVGRTVIKGIMTFAGSIAQIIISFVIAGILLVVGGAGESIRKFFRKVGGDRGDEFADITVKTVGSVIKGILGESLVMAFLFGLVFVFSSVPFAGIWTLVAFVLAVIQVPTIVITVPTIAYYFAVQEAGTASIWSVVILLVGAADNVLTPIMLGKGAPVPMLVIFIGAIGGFIISGFSGLFTGAVVMSLGYNLFKSWINTENIV